MFRVIVVLKQILYRQALTKVDFVSTVNKTKAKRIRDVF